MVRRHKLILGKLTRILDSTFPDVYFLVILVRENFVFNLFLTVNKKHVLEQKKSARNINLSWSQNIFRFETNSVVWQSWLASNYKKLFRTTLNREKKMKITSSLIWLQHSEYKLELACFTVHYFVLYCSCKTKPSTPFSSKKSIVS